MRMAVFISHSAEETFEFAKRYAVTLHGGDVVLLGGDMGAGKTAFTRGLVMGLGAGDVASSPTFALVNEYTGRLTVEHFDMTAHDQANISNMATGAFMGMTAYPYHCKDGNCKVYTAEQIAKIYVTTQLFLTSTNTKFNQLKQYVKSFEGAEDSKESECMSITMETVLPEQYQAVYDQMMQEAQAQIMAVISKIQVGGETKGASEVTDSAAE